MGKSSKFIVALILVMVLMAFLIPATTIMAHEGAAVVSETGDDQDEAEPAKPAKKPTIIIRFVFSGCSWYRH